MAICQDRELEEAILGAVARLHLPDVQTLRVQVIDGVAFIDGHVGNYQEKKAIGRLAASVSGLRKVVNRLRVVPAALVRDEALAERTRRAIESRPSLAGQPISVRCKEGVIELSGTVDRPTLRLHAEDAAWSVCGVRQVVNKLQVSRPLIPDERELAEHIQGLLQYCLELNPGCISVEVERGAAYLDGSVPSRAFVEIAEDVVRWHPHIQDVVNRLAVEEIPSSRKYELTA